MKSSHVKKILLALSLGVGLNGFVSVTATAGPALECHQLEDLCRMGDRNACYQLERYCRIAP
ncbi:hypothetical protein SG34_015995 [Thalassomonas viridans]|uniref:Uncharacterized protein n=1 Tax=Thalassomonas viridans TaxID=137584 RepID=A0AAE9YXW5_9GAMM|nr:hypothetical protein [Thalassomonas viridans]WDE02943.1 hypothetical protein SG34_015995 [Thalassomonas viridans]